MSESNNTLLDKIQVIKKEIRKVIIGQEHIIDLALIVIMCGEHALIEGVPGIAKTLLVRTLARIMGCDFKRIQFTPDLMPIDITGTNVFNMKKGEFNLMKGPVFTSFLLADEINRAPAKTQSALLQAMQERKVTIDTATHDLSGNFTVFATQNPVEYEGTYPLPEAQKDRFMLKLYMDYPDENEEFNIAKMVLEDNAPEKNLAEDQVVSVFTEENLAGLRTMLNEISLSEDILRYLVQIVRKSREEESILVGAGPRATLCFVKAVKAYAALNNRDYVVPDDVKELAYSVLAHRIVIRPEYEIEHINEKYVIESLLEKVAVPS